MYHSKKLVLFYAPIFVLILIFLGDSVYNVFSLNLMHKDFSLVICVVHFDYTAQSIFLDLFAETRMKNFKNNAYILGGVLIAFAFLLCIINIFDDDNKPCPNNNNIVGQKMYKRYKNQNTIRSTAKDYENICALNLFAKAIIDNHEVAYEIANIEHPNKTINILRELCCHFFVNRDVEVNLYPYELEFCNVIRNYMKENKVIIACKAGEVIIRELEFHLGSNHINYLKDKIGNEKATEEFKAFVEEKLDRNTLNGLTLLPFKVENGKILPIEAGTEDTKDNKEDDK